MWACTYGIDHWMPAKLMGQLTTKLVDLLTPKRVDHLNAKLVNYLTAKLVNRLTTKLVVVNLVKLHLTNFNQLPHLSGRWMPGYPGASTVASQSLDRILPPWLANPRNPAMSPHSKPRGLSELTQARSEREIGAQGWGKPWSWTTKVLRHPTKTTRKGGYVRNTCRVSRLATSTIVLMGVQN